MIYAMDGHLVYYCIPIHRPFSPRTAFANI